MTAIQTSFRRGKPSWRGHLRLVSVLAAKDVIDALKTKTTLTTIVLSLLMVLFYRYLPLLTADDNTLKVRVYAEAGARNSALVSALERSPALAAYAYDSRERLMASVAGAEDVELALVIPETVAAQQASGGPIAVEGYLMYWVGDAKRAEIKALVEDDLSRELGRPVTVDLSGHDVTFDAGEFFFAFSPTIALLFVAIMIGISLIPNLMVEEKQARTLDALLVSPASPADIVAGKAIAGLFYGLLGSAVVLVVFRYLILQWDLAILAAVLSTLFMVAIGLLLGSYVKVRAQLQLLAWFFVIPLLVPVVLVALEGLVPSEVIAVLNWIPTVLLAKVFRMCMTPNASFTHYGPAVSVTLASTLLVLALVVWNVHRQDRG